MVLPLVSQLIQQNRMYIIYVCIFGDIFETVFFFADQNESAATDADSVGGGSARTALVDDPTRPLSPIEPVSACASDERGVSNQRVLSQQSSVSTTKVRHRPGKGSKDDGMSMQLIVAKVSFQVWQHQLSCVVCQRLFCLILVFQF